MKERDVTSTPYRIVFLVAHLSLYANLPVTGSCGNTQFPYKLLTYLLVEKKAPGIEILFSNQGILSCGSSFF
jgi:hypothetical protein